MSALDDPAVLSARAEAYADRVARALRIEVDRDIQRGEDEQALAAMRSALVSAFTIGYTAGASELADRVTGFAGRK